MQIGSLFASIQQVETERHKPQETTEEYNRCKAIANLTKARYMKQMEKITKQFKKETVLTHNYSMPKPTNTGVLTNTLSTNIPDEIATPNFENNIEDELTKLGIGSTLLTTTNSKTNQQGLKKTSTLPSLVSHAAPPSSRTTQQQEISMQETGRITLKQQYHDAQTNQEGSKKTLTFPSSVSHARGTQEQEKRTHETSRTTSKQQDDDALEHETQLLPESTVQGDKPEEPEQQCQTKKAETTETINQEGSKKTLTFPSSVSHARRTQEQEKRTHETSRTTSKQQDDDALEHETQLLPESTVQGDKPEENEQQCQTKKVETTETINQEGSKKTLTFPSSVSHTRRTQEQEKRTHETSRTTSKQQDDDALEHETQLLPESTVQGDKPEEPEQQCQTKKAETTETINHKNAKQTEKRTSGESNTEDQPQSSKSMQPTKRISHGPSVQSLKLSQKEHDQAYPWAHEASENMLSKTELSNEVEYVNIPLRLIRNYLTSQMRDQLAENINLPDVITERINNCIGMTEKNDKPMYFCKVCNMASPYHHPKKAMCARHVRIHLGYSLYRCSFCSFISNTANSVYSHYMTKHGIPKEWIISEKN